MNQKKMLEYFPTLTTQTYNIQILNRYMLTNLKPILYLMGT